MFDTVFYHFLKARFQDKNYDFLNLTLYLDKFMDKKRIVENSIFTFLVPSEGADWTLIVADLNQHRFVIYDPNPDKYDYENDVEMLKKFMSDFLEFYKFTWESGRIDTYTNSALLGNCADEVCYQL